MRRPVGHYLISAAFVLISWSAFPQALNEFRDTEPGSLLFFAEHLLIATSAAAAAIGAFKRTRWAAQAIGICGLAAVGLLLSQPLFASMTSEGLDGIWLGAAVVGAAAAAMAWYTRRVARPAAANHPSPDPAHQQPSSPALLTDARRPAETLIPPAPDAHVPRGAASSHRVDSSHE